MNKRNIIKFDRLDEPNIYGYGFTREDNIKVEVVQCYDCDWNVFLTIGGHVVARSVAEYRKCGNGYVSRFDAFAIARSLAQ